MVRVIPFGKIRKISAVFWGDAIFLLFLDCSADLVCVNGKNPRVSVLSGIGLKTQRKRPSVSNEKVGLDLYTPLIAIVISDILKI